MNVLLLGKKDNSYVQKAVRFCQQNISDLEIHLSNKHDPLPDDIGWWSGDYIISFLSYQIIPEYLLKRAKIAAINFHPAPPEYPGVGCYNFALYDGAPMYGATCHHMTTKIDAGDIIATKRFSLYKNDDIETVIERTYDNLIVLFYEIMDTILHDQDLPTSNEIWGKQATTRKELDALSTITSTMSRLEIEKRVTATTYGAWKPTIQIGDYTFELQTKKSY